MKKLSFTVLLITAALLLYISGAFAETTKTVTDKFELTTKVQGCDIDMKQHCRDVTPGNNRQTLCLMAHEDKLLNSCKIGLVESSMVLEMGVATLDYAHEACGSDRVKYCGNVAAGEGRLINCFVENREKLKKECNSALQEIGLWNANIQPSAGQTKQ